MVQSYKISGMTCKACTQMVDNSISIVVGVKKVDVDLTKEQANVEMEYPIPIETLQAALAGTLYQISETVPQSKQEPPSKSEKEIQEQNKKL